MRSSRRRRSTRRAAVLAGCGLAFAAGAGTVGGVAIYNTTDGEVRAPATIADRLPSTETALVGVVDEAGSLGSLVVVALPPRTPSDDDGDAGEAGAGSDAPDGRDVGGRIVVVPVTADAAGGQGGQLQLLGETYRSLGLDAMLNEVQHLLGVSIDAAAVLTAEELAVALEPLGRVELELPHTVRDRTGRTLAVAGSRRLPVNRVAAILASGTDGETALARYETDVAVWRALAGLVGPGLDEPIFLGVGLDALATSASSLPAESLPTESLVAGPPDAGSPDAGSPDPGATFPDGSEVTAGPVADRVVDAGAVTERFARLTAGPVEVARLTVEHLADLGRNPQGVPAVALDHAEVVTLFAHLTPDQMAAPNQGLNLRLVSPYADGALPGHLSRYHLAYAATAAALAWDANVISADTSPGTAPETTVVEIADEALADAAAELEEVLGPVEVRLAERRLAGVDAVVTLGASAVSALDASIVSTFDADAISALDATSNGDV